MSATHVLIAFSSRASEKRAGKNWEYLSREYSSTKHLEIVRKRDCVVELAVNCLSSIRTEVVGSISRKYEIFSS